MHPGILAQQHPDKPAYIMAESGKVVTRRELEDASNLPSCFANWA